MGDISDEGRGQLDLVGGDEGHMELNGPVPVIVFRDEKRVHETQARRSVPMVMLDLPIFAAGRGEAEKAVAFPEG